MHKPEGQQPNPKLFRAMDALRLTVFGWYFATCLLLGALGGWALDRWVGSKPLFILLGIVLGTVIGFYGMYRMLKPLMREKKESLKGPQK